MSCSQLTSGKEGSCFDPAPSEPDGKKSCWLHNISNLCPVFLGGLINSATTHPKKRNFIKSIQRNAQLFFETFWQKKKKGIFRA